MTVTFHSRASFLLALLLVVGAPIQGRSDPGSEPARAILTPVAWGEDVFNIRHFFSGLNRRDRVVQFCAIVMCLALFILMKKFDARNFAP